MSQQVSPCLLLQNLIHICIIYIFGFSKWVEQKLRQVNFSVTKDKQGTNRHSCQGRSPKFSSGSIDSVKILFFQYFKRLIRNHNYMQTLLKNDKISRGYDMQILAFLLIPNGLPYNILNSSLTSLMFDKPNWLDLSEQLYPPILMSKIFIIENQQGTIICEMEGNVIYNSYNRQIDVTDAVATAINSCLQNKNKFNEAETKQEVEIFNFEEEKYQNGPTFPFTESFILKGCFVELQIIKLRITDVQKPMKSLQLRKGKKTVKDVVKLVAQWRKIYLSKEKKITLEEAAAEVGVPKNTLDDYYRYLKTAQKHQFDFSANFDKPFRFLREFVQMHNEKKEKDIAPVMAILEKYHPK